MFTSRRCFVDRPKPDQRVDLVGKRHGDGNSISRNQIVWPLWLPMILTGMRHGFVFALRLSVISPHRALHLGKFTDNFGKQIRFAQPRRSFCLSDIRPDQRRQFGDGINRAYRLKDCFWGSRRVKGNRPAGVHRMYRIGDGGEYGNSQHQRRLADRF